MTSVSRSVRLLLLLGLVSTAAGALWAWRRDRLDPKHIDTTAAEWPDLQPVPMRAATVESSDIASPNGLNGADATPAASDAPTSGDGWVSPDADGSCPTGFEVKANQTGIYHLPGGRSYDRTNPERCYAEAAAAERDGYRAAKA